MLNIIHEIKTLYQAISTKKCKEGSKEEQRIENKRVIQKTKRKMANINPIISTITLNMNSPDTPIKRHRLLNWIKKQDSIMCCI